MMRSGRVPLFVVTLGVVWWASLVAGDIFLNQFSVKVDGGRAEAEEVARSLGFTVDHELPGIKTFLLSHADVNNQPGIRADGHVERLQAHPKVVYAQQEPVLVREKRRIIHDKQLEMPIREISDFSLFHRVKDTGLTARSEIPGEDEILFEDPLYEDQWYLKNTGQSGGKIGLDLNLEVAWKQGFTGTGVVVCILDDGIDHTHEDLINNYDATASTDLNDLNDQWNDPMPNLKNPNNRHGTLCAGEIAATGNNSVCGVGVAFTSKIGGVRILDGKVTDPLEAQALNFRNDYIDIYSASWGPKDDGKSMEGPPPLARKALRDGVEEGRNGLGSIFVIATGNGGLFDDDCSADGYVSSIETLSVGSVTEHGTLPFFMELCTSTLAVVPSGGEEEQGEEVRTGITKLKVVTTDINNHCQENFQGTSSAAPLMAGCVALMLQANSSLSWRDVQNIVVYGSRIPSVDDSWVLNGAGLHVSHKFGHGMLDCGYVVYLAQNWKHVPEQHTCRQQSGMLNMNLHSRDTISNTIGSNGCHGTADQIDLLEHVQIHIRLEHARRGDVKITLKSPSGTTSEMLSPRRRDDSSEGIDFKFMTVHSWHEDPRGSWELEVHDVSSEDMNDELKGKLISWSLTLYGTSGTWVNDELTSNDVTGYASMPSPVDFETLMLMEENRTVAFEISPYSESDDQSKKSISSKKPAETTPSKKFVEDLLAVLQGDQGSKNTKTKFGFAQERNFGSSREFHGDQDSWYDVEIAKKNIHSHWENDAVDSHASLEDDVLDVLAKAFMEDAEEHEKKMQKTTERKEKMDSLHNRHQETKEINRRQYWEEGWSKGLRQRSKKADREEISDEDLSDLVQQVKRLLTNNDDQKKLRQEIQRRKEEEQRRLEEKKRNEELDALLTEVREELEARDQEQQQQQQVLEQREEDEDEISLETLIDVLKKELKTEKGIDGGRLRDMGVHPSG